jgi:hypothetical protein
VQNSDELPQSFACAEIMHTATHADTRIRLITGQL